MGALFDAYLQLRGGSTVFVGEVESVRGLSVLLLALPIGFATDRFPKHRVLVVNWMMGALAVASLLVGVVSDQIWLIIPGAVLLSIHNQCLFGLLPVMVSEVSETAEDRTLACTGLAVCSSLGSASGPAVQLAFALLTHRDRWSLTALHLVLAIGGVFFLLYSPCIHGVAALNARRLGSIGDARTALTSADTAADSGVGGEPREGVAPGCAPAAPATGSLDASPDAVASPAPVPAFNWLIAGLCETSSMVTAIGSGMTFKYWPLFFKSDFGFSPTGVCVLQFGIWLAIAMANVVAPALAHRIGRLPAANIYHVTGTCLLFVISNQSLGVYAEVPLVLVRNAIMNSGAPLVLATVLELVPNRHQGKWSQVASLRRMTWSGSAFLGGLLSDSHDFRYAFFITACVHTCAGTVLLLTNALLWRRDRREALAARGIGGCGA